MKIITSYGVIHREFPVNGQVLLRIADQGLYKPSRGFLGHPIPVVEF